MLKMSHLLAIKNQHGTAKQTQKQLTEHITLPFFKRIQSFVIGQQHVADVAAVIEAPYAIQPNREYTLRIRLQGRSEPKTNSGLSSLREGKLVHIEVLSSPERKETRLIQQVDVPIPGRNQVAIVKIPMQVYSHSANGWHERLQVVFQTQAHHPLYERPFIIEMFISPLIPFGHEGYSALSIPL